MDKKEKMLASLEKNLPEIKQNRPIKIDKDVKNTVLIQNQQAFQPGEKIEVLRHIE